MHNVYDLFPRSVRCEWWKWKRKSRTKDEIERSSAPQCAWWWFPLTMDMFRIVISGVYTYMHLADYGYTYCTYGQNIYIFILCVRGQYATAGMPLLAVLGASVPTVMQIMRNASAMWMIVSTDSSARRRFSYRSPSSECSNNHTMRRRLRQKTTTTYCSHTSLSHTHINTGCMIGVRSTLPS